MALRLDLEGLRVKMPGAAAVYVIDGGKKRLIPNMDVYAQVFRETNNIHPDLHLDLIDTGEAIPTNAILFTINHGSGAVFLLDGTVKRIVASPAVMNRFGFAGPLQKDKDHMVDIPDGPALTKEGPPN